jgi:hypothetical protein
VSRDSLLLLPGTTLSLVVPTYLCVVGLPSEEIY